jgi:6-phosphofructokinase
VTAAVLKNIEMLALDYLIAIGGDDTLSYASELDRKSIKVIGGAEDNGQRRPQH